MTDPVVICDQGVTIIGRGVCTADDLDQAMRLAPLLIAADGGADRALELGRMPRWVIGDLDSLGPSSRRRIAPAHIVAVAEQDSTDFAKCLMRIRAPFVIATGFAGLRLDHTLAALTVMVQDWSFPVIMLAAEDVVFLCPPRITLDLPAGTRVSLYPMGPAQGTATGLEWSLEGIVFTPADRVGTSNRATGRVDLAMQGPMLVMLPRDSLGPVMAGLGLAVT